MAPGLQILSCRCVGKRFNPLVVQKSSGKIRLFRHSGNRKIALRVANMRRIFHIGATLFSRSVVVLRKTRHNCTNAVGALFDRRFESGSEKEFGMKCTMGILRRSLVTALAVMALICFSAINVLATTRPTAVPEDYVITPFGYFHPSCVQGLAENELLLSDGRVQRADGSFKAAQSCSFPHFSPSGEKIAQGVTAREMTALDSTTASEIAPVIRGWVEYVSTTTSTSYGEISATWTVPAAPSTYEDQTVFFFPGFEDTNDIVTIVQPVLQYGPSQAGGGDYWSIASWNCCYGGQTWYSSLKKVSVGDTISGEILPACPKKKAASCTTWKIITEDETTLKKSTLNQSSADGQTWNWAFGAVLEAYGVKQCSDFPTTTSLALTVQVFNASFDQISDPGWSASPASAGLTPQCSYGLNVTDSVETLEY
jgi:hypothetical protein